MAGQQKVVKCYLADNRDGTKEIRKFLVDQSAAGMFSAIREKIVMLFSQLALQEFRVFYIDEEGDKIIISSDDELVASQLTVNDPMIRLNLEVVGEKKDLPNQRSTGDELGSCKGDLHKGVICDVCDSQIRGFRYKCLKCPDYDLCGRCEAAGNHPGHMMARVSGPLDQFPRIFRAVRGLNGSWVTRDSPGGGESARSSSARQQTRFGGKGFGCRSAERTEAGRRPTPGGEFLKNVGSSIASLLQPLGIDVHVDVHTAGENVHCAPFMNTQQPETSHKGHGNGSAKPCNTSSDVAVQVAQQAVEAVKLAEASAAAKAAQHATSQMEILHAATAVTNNAAEAAQRATEQLCAATATVDSVGLQLENFSLEQHNPIYEAESPGEEQSCQAPEAASLTESTKDALYAKSTKDASFVELKDASFAEPTKDASFAEPTKDVSFAEPTEDASFAEPDNTGTSSSRSSSSGENAEDWTIVDAAKSAEEVVLLNQQIHDFQSETQGARPKASTALTVDSVATGGCDGLYPNLQSLEPKHPDPTIAAALETMLNMGFTNEGGWLLQLLEVKNGDISKVMDVLHGPF